MTHGSREDRIRTALERIVRWMNAHGAPLLVENLAPGASSEALAQVEAGFGCALPTDLRALWSLHDGQREDGNGFVEAFDLLSSRQALAEQETVVMLLDLLRERPDDWHETGATAEELQSNHWLPFAARDSDSLVVSGVSGRVFSCDHDDAPRLLASSLAEWLEGYAARVEADDYAVEEGFGDYYLQRRDREAERRMQQREQREAERERYRRETPLLDQLRDGLARRDADRCTEVLKDALQRDTQAFHEAVALLFASRPEPKLVAGALRPLLDAVALAPDQWVDVAVGGALLENHAIRDVALSRCAGASSERVAHLAEEARRASGTERELHANVLEKVRASTPAPSTAPPDDAPPGNWLSRLFGKRAPKE
jgi:cell wall assembly regulator SMI1